MMTISTLRRMTLASCLALMTLSACNKADEPIIGGGQTGSEEPGGVPGLDNDILSIFAYNGTTEISTGQWADGHSIGLFLTKDSLGNPYENNYDAYSNIPAVYTKEGWTTVPAAVKLTERPAIVYAYSPYRPDIDPRAMHVECASGTYYMYGTHAAPQTSVRKGSMIVRLLFKQAQSLIDFRMKKRDWRGDLELQRIVIRRATDSSSRTGGSVVADTTSVTGLPIEGNLDIQTGDMTYTAYGQYDSGPMSQTVTENISSTARVLMPVMPLTAEDGPVELAFTVNGREMSVVLDEDTYFTSGARNVINLTFTGEGIEVNSSIKDWADSTQQDITVNT